MMPYRAAKSIADTASSLLAQASFRFGSLWFERPRLAARTS
jgi:hypothetical protein